MTPQQFIAKWQQSTLSERSAYQQHFLDLCELLGQPKPAAADPDGAWYTFERGLRKTTGDKGWADVWMRGHFGWEYKGKNKDLDRAYQQLLLYREDLENPPLLVVCDLQRFEIHTNFTGTPKQVHRFDLAGLADPENLETLRKVFTEPEALRPGITTESITRQAAERFGLLADGMRVRGVEAPQAAHFLMKLMFCMFGEDIGLLPKEIFGRVLEGGRKDPERLAGRLRSLFEAMSTGGDFGADEIMYFNGGLFADAEVIDLRPEEIEALIRANDYDWAHVEPSIFGTLFERTLDPAKRSQIGAHYTSRADILTLLEPVVMTPLRREWDEVRARCDKRWEKVRAGASKQSTRPRKPSKATRDFERELLNFVERLAHVTILDPACGSGNFLYVAINLLLDLEKEVIAYAAGRGVSIIPHVRPTQLAGIEINPYAQQLAQVVIWIGYLQWMHHNGFKAPTDPVLEPIESIHLMDAILDLSDPQNPKEPEWPEADFIVGNPPFLGGKLLRTNLGDDYVDAVFQLWDGRVPREGDLCCYWFEKARGQIAQGKCKRAGLLATQGIRGGANRKVLERIKETGEIFFAESDRDWILDGATVHISMVGFGQQQRATRFLNGKLVSVIHANLTATSDITQAAKLRSNAHMAFMGITPSGPFVIPDNVAQSLLAAPNPHGRPNSDVVRPWVNGADITRRTSQNWIVDLNKCETLAEAALYEEPFRFVRAKVSAARQSYRTGGEVIWKFERARPQMRAALAHLRRYLARSMVGKHQFFVWLSVDNLPANLVIVVAADNYSLFGVLHSRSHELWALHAGTRLETRPRYTPTTCFETFPFPEAGKTQQQAIGEAAKELDDLRTTWLNPPEWTRQEVLEFPGSVDGPWARYIDPATVSGGSVPLPLAGEGGERSEPGEGGREVHGANRSANRPHPSPLPEGKCPHPGPLPEGKCPHPGPLPEGKCPHPGPLPEGEGGDRPANRPHPRPLSRERERGGVGTVRYPRVVARDEECAKALKKRTLTNLYNQRPTWLDLAHRKLDEAVFAAYGWEPDLSDEEILARLLDLNLKRAGV
jgi:hypothetical protein